NKRLLMGKNPRLSLFIFLLYSLSVHSQNRFTLSGTVTEISSNETLIGVTIAIPSLGTGVITNEYGFYSITLPKGMYEVRISSIGYRDIAQKVDLSVADQQINFQLMEAVEQLEEVTVTEDVEKLNIRKPQMSVNSLSVETIKKIP